MNKYNIFAVLDAVLVWMLIAGAVIVVVYAARLLPWLSLAGHTAIWILAAIIAVVIELRRHKRWFAR